MVRGTQPLPGALRPAWQAVPRPCQGVWAGRRHGRRFVPTDRLGGVGQPGRDQAWFFPRKWPGLDRRPLGRHVAGEAWMPVAGSGSTPRCGGRGRLLCRRAAGSSLPLREGRADPSGSRTDGSPAARSRGRLGHRAVGAWGWLLSALLWPPCARLQKGDGAPARRAAWRRSRCPCSFPPVFCSLSETLLRLFAYLFMR